MQPESVAPMSMDNSTVGKTILDEAPNTMKSVSMDIDTIHGAKQIMTGDTNENLRPAIRGPKFEIHVDRAKLLAQRAKTQAEKLEKMRAAEASEQGRTAEYLELELKSEREFIRECELRSERIRAQQLRAERKKKRRQASSMPATRLAPPAVGYYNMETGDMELSNDAGMGEAGSCTGTMTVTDGSAEMERTCTGYSYL